MSSIIIETIYFSICQCIPLCHKIKVLLSSSTPVLILLHLFLYFYTCSYTSQYESNTPHCVHLSFDTLPPASLHSINVQLPCFSSHFFPNTSSSLLLLTLLPKHLIFLASPHTSSQTPHLPCFSSHLFPNTSSSLLLLTLLPKHLIFLASPHTSSQTPHLPCFSSHFFPNTSSSLLLLTLLPKYLIFLASLHTSSQTPHLPCFSSHFFPNTSSSLLLLTLLPKHLIFLASPHTSSQTPHLPCFSSHFFPNTSSSLLLLIPFKPHFLNVHTFFKCPHKFEVPMSTISITVLTNRLLVFSSFSILIFLLSRHVS